MTENPLDFFPSFEEWLGLKKEINSISGSTREVKKLEFRGQMVEPDFSQRNGAYTPTPAAFQFPDLQPPPIWYYYAPPGALARQADYLRKKQELALRQQQAEDREKRIHEVRRILYGDYNGPLGSPEGPESQR